MHTVKNALFISMDYCYFLTASLCHYFVNQWRLGSQMYHQHCIPNPKLPKYHQTMCMCPMARCVWMERRMSQAHRQSGQRMPASSSSLYSWSQTINLKWLMMTQASGGCPLITVFGWRGEEGGHWSLGLSQVNIIVTTYTQCGSLTPSGQGSTVALIY